MNKKKKKNNKNDNCLFSGNGDARAHLHVGDDCGRRWIEFCVFLFCVYFLMEKLGYNKWFSLFKWLFVYFLLSFFFSNEKKTSLRFSQTNEQLGARSLPPFGCPFVCSYVHCLTVGVLLLVFVPIMNVRRRKRLPPKLMVFKNEM